MHLDLGPTSKSDRRPVSGGIGLDRRGGCKGGHEGSKSFTEERERRFRGPWDENMGRRYTVSQGDDNMPS